MGRWNVDGTSSCSASGRRRANRSASNSLTDNPFSGDEGVLLPRLRHHKARKCLLRTQKCDVHSTFHRPVRIGLMSLCFWEYLHLRSLHM